MFSRKTGCILYKKIIAIGELINFYLLTVLLHILLGILLHILLDVLYNCTLI